MVKKCSWEAGLHSHTTFQLPLKPVVKAAFCWTQLILATSLHTFWCRVVTLPGFGQEATVQMLLNNKVIGNPLSRKTNRHVSVGISYVICCRLACTLAWVGKHFKSTNGKKVERPILSKGHHTPLSAILTWSWGLVEKKMQNAKQTWSTSEMGHPGEDIYVWFYFYPFIQISIQSWSLINLYKQASE